jgi:hypothetical protein
MEKLSGLSNETWNLSKHFLNARRSIGKEDIVVVVDYQDTRMTHVITIIYTKVQKLLVLC